ncbi:MAG: T9SS type A sorting domain-containing protein [Dysgonamonadaceae bacterium]|jgi:hypothetical protein|nr:T9SS type A sorting domain-containing protein [Dysgonamonadaceae bacterium]
MKTKIPAIILFLLLSLPLIKGQNYTYIPYVEEDIDVQWSYVRVTQIGSTVEQEYITEYSNYLLKGDTIINGVKYKKLLSGCSGEYIAALKEVDKKVFIKEDDKHERLLYDFNLKEGDSMENNGLSYRVTKIDTVRVGDTERKRFNFENFDVWTEGIGSLHAFYPLQPYATGYEAEEINYQKKNSEIVYKTDQWYFNENECGFTRIQQPAPSEDYAVRISEDGIFLRFSTKETIQISLIDTMGKRYYQSPFFSPQTTEYRIGSTASFPKGIYLLKVFYQTGNRIKISKIILH